MHPNLLLNQIEPTTRRPLSGDVRETDCVSAKTENGFKWASSAHDDYMTCTCFTHHPAMRPEEFLSAQLELELE